MAYKAYASQAFIQPRGIGISHEICIHRFTNTWNARSHSLAQPSYGVHETINGFLFIVQVLPQIKELAANNLQYLRTAAWIKLAHSMLLLQLFLLLITALGHEQYADKPFRMFQRLHREGESIGLFWTILN